MRQFDYNSKDLAKTYRNIGICRGRVVYLTGNLGRLGAHSTFNKEALLDAHLQVILDLLGSEGTLLVPTHSWSLCNTKTVFDPLSTKSETGPFTELVRVQEGAIRQFHPYSSTTGLGADASDICANTARHVYGPETPFQRMVDRNALYVSVGMPMERTISLVHHIERLMGVPYRYTKEFIQPCKIGNEIINELFYLYVCYRNCDIVRDRNKKIMEQYRSLYPVPKLPLGRSFVESLDTALFFKSTIQLFSKDIYIWLKQPPINRSSYQA